MATSTRSGLTGIRLKRENGSWLVHPNLRARMVADAQAKHTNLTDLATQILSERFSVPYEPSSRRSSPQPDSGDQMNFRLPDRLKRKIVASSYPLSLTDAIRKALCDHYDLQIPQSSAAA
jgi:hypothetical protein